MGLLDRINAKLAPARPQNLSLDEYASWFSFGGNQYPLMQTTYSQIDQERIAWTADWAAKSGAGVLAGPGPHAGVLPGAVPVDAVPGLAAG
jgi:hypothetical protein